MFLKICASDVTEATVKGRHGDKSPAMDFRGLLGNKARGFILQLQNTTSRAVIRQVPNSNSDHTFSKQLQVLYTDVMHWDELINFMETSCGPKRPYWLTVISKSSLSQEELDEVYTVESVQVKTKTQFETRFARNEGCNWDGYC